MKFPRVLFFAACILSLSASACELADLEFLAANNKLQYGFVQHKTVAALSRPLVSDGILTISENDELIWQTLHPLKSTLVIGAGGLRQFNRNDVLVGEISNPVAARLSQVFLKLLSGNTKSLTADFTLTVTCEADVWHLSLVPDTPEFKNLLSSISLSGSKYLEKITFQEARGDYSEITLAVMPADQLKNFEIYLGD